MAKVTAAKSASKSTEKVTAKPATKPLTQPQSASPKTAPEKNNKIQAAKAALKKVEAEKTAPILTRAVFKPIPKPEAIGEDLIAECREKLLASKTELLNRVKETRGKFDQFERGGDEADQTMRILAEQEMMNLTDRLRSQLLEIESALSRIENGTFGVCEETDELIETDRLKAIPWTRLSIEGAEIRESMTKRYAR